MNHGKPKSDELGGVNKSLVSQAVTNCMVMIRNASDFYSFCQESVTHKNKQSPIDNSFLLNQMNQVF